MRDTGPVLGPFVVLGLDLRTLLSSNLSESISDVQSSVQPFWSDNDRGSSHRILEIVGMSLSLMGCWNSARISLTLMIKGRKLTALSSLWTPQHGSYIVVYSHGPSPLRSINSVRQEGGESILILPQRF